MNLWSKGLGRMVLDVRLSERTGVDAELGQTVIHGTMGAPVFWDFSVRLSGDDILDFLQLLQQPPVVRFVATSPHRWAILRAAVVGAVIFAGAFVSRLITRPSMTQTQTQTGEIALSLAPDTVAGKGDEQR